MAKLVKCRICGADISSSAKVCPQCGAKNKKPIHKRWWFWAIIVVLILSAIGGGGSKDKDGTTNTNNTKTSSTAESKTSTASTTSPTEQTYTVKTDFDTTGYTNMSVSVLKEYGTYLVGEKMVVAFVVADTGSDSLKANVSEDDLTYALLCEFDRAENISKSFSKGEKVTVAGTVKEASSVTSTTTLADCTVIGHGEIIDAIAADSDSQIQFAEAAKTRYEANVAAELKAEREEYAASCETVSYREVERNPDSYKGKKIKVSGKVIQVSEGWFDSVTLRLDEGNGNTWYVTYTRKDGESRILENDYITCYGECTGVESYLSVLGAQVTIPAMKMEYHD